MFIEILSSKIHRATVTDADVNYVGSITIDEVLIKKADHYDLYGEARDDFTE